MTGIPEINRVIRHRIHAFCVRRPQRFDRQAKVQQLQQVVRAGKAMPASISRALRYFSTHCWQKKLAASGKNIYRREEANKAVKFLRSSSPARDLSELPSVRLPTGGKLVTCGVQQISGKFRGRVRMRRHRCARAGAGHDDQQSTSIVGLRRRRAEEEIWGGGGWWGRGRGGEGRAFRFGREGILARRR